MTTPHLRKSRGRSPLRLGFLLIPLALAWFALSQTAQAQLPSPSPDGGYPGQNTAEGDGALSSLTLPTGANNTAIGFDALNNNTTGAQNTANGNQALYTNTIGGDNTAIGHLALYSNTTGNTNTAIGAQSLQSNTTGFFNEANGNSALTLNTTGAQNTANGFAALYSNSTGNITRLMVFKRSTTTQPEAATSQWAFKQVTILPRAVVISILGTLVSRTSPEPSALAQPELRGKPLSPVLAGQRLQVA